MAGEDRNNVSPLQAAIAQLGERQTEDLKVPGSIPGRGIHHDATENAVGVLLECSNYKN